MAAMKLLMCITDDARADAVVDALVRVQLRVTRLATTGGFLRKGNTTLLVGLDDDRVDEALELVRQVAPGTTALTLPLERYERL